MSKFTSLLLLSLAALSCATERPSRTGVFNENQYLRKDFLTGVVDEDNADKDKQDPGWLLRVTVTETSTPNLLGADFSVWGGLQTEINLVRFRITQDKLQLVSMRQFSAPASGMETSPSVTDTVDNAWSATNVDLKYRVNLDGERSNFFEENQELPWAQRQWVKLNFAKNDFSDLEPLGTYTNDLLGHCADLGDASATPLPDSLYTEGQGDDDLSNDYLEFGVQVTLAMKFDDPGCIEAYGAMFENAARLGRSHVTINLKYSFRRAQPAKDITYKKFLLAEKDAIHHKYGPFLYTTFDRDPHTGLVAANQYVGRFDPEKPIVWYFDAGFPDKYKKFFNDSGAMRDQTNKILEKSGAKARVEFKEPFDGIDVDDDAKDELSCDKANLFWQDGKCYRSRPRQYGDIRYNFLRWASDEDLQDGFAGVTMPGFDPRTGEIINESIELNDFAIKDFYVQRIDAFLRSVGASQDINAADPMTMKPIEWGCPDSGCSCSDGDTLPIAPNTVVAEHNARSTLFSKMQQYLNIQSKSTDPSQNHLGPQDFIENHDDDFYRAYYALLPFELFSDPDMNLFVTREGGSGVYGPAGVWQHLQDQAEFHALTARMNNGETPYDDPTGTDGLRNATAFANHFRTLTSSHLDYARMKDFIHSGIHRDSPEAFSLESVIIKDSRRCLGGQWESKQSWTDGLIESYWQQVIWHEFGHALGLEHNFMASVDKPNFPDPQMGKDGAPHYSLYASSVMVGSSRVDLQACKLEYSIVSPK